MSRDSRRYSKDRASVGRSESRQARSERGDERSRSEHSMRDKRGSRSISEPKREERGPDSNPE